MIVKCVRGIIGYPETYEFKSFDLDYKVLNYSDFGGVYVSGNYLHCNGFSVFFGKSVVVSLGGYVFYIHQVNKYSGFISGELLSPKSVSLSIFNGGFGRLYFYDEINEVLRSEGCLCGRLSIECEHSEYFFYTVFGCCDFSFNLKKIRGILC